MTAPETPATYLSREEETKKEAPRGREDIPIYPQEFRTCARVRVRALFYEDPIVSGDFLR